MEKQSTTTRHQRPLGGDTARSTRSTVTLDLTDQILSNGVAVQTLALPRKPKWIRAKLPSGPGFELMRARMQEHGLHTVCQEASCPNIGDCWARGTATIMILGDTCTRSCGFCNVRTGKPAPPDPNEPDNVGKSIALMKLRHIVITCVDRDDLADGGANHWAQTIRAVRKYAPNTSIEALIGDFKGDVQSLRTVIEAKPDILSHNLETVPRMHRAVRPQARYNRSMEVLMRIRDARIVSKTSIMVGIGETDEEVLTMLADIRSCAQTQIITIGQYLQPSRNHLPVDRWVHPDQFAIFKEKGLQLGFRVVESGPMVRSSFHAEEQILKLESLEQI